MGRIFAPFLLLASLLHPQPASQLDRMIGRVEGSILRITGEEDYMTMFGPMHGTYVCTGFMVDRRLAMTANHCLGDTMRADGAAGVKVLATDEYLDLALLLVDSNKPALTFDTHPLGRFTKVYGVGYGGGHNRTTITSGKVLWVAYVPDELADEAAPGIWLMGRFIHGMSGGPVVNSQGRVVMMVQRTNENLGYGASAATIVDFIQNR